MFWRFYNIEISINIKRTFINPMWNVLILNCFTNSCILNTYVTWQGTDYEPLRMTR